MLKQLIISTLFSLFLLLITNSAMAALDWDFSYSYGNPDSDLAKQYIISQDNVTVLHESPFYYWCPASPGPGEIIMEFDFSQKTDTIHLFAKMPTFHWSYGEGHNYLYGSNDGSSWIQLLDVPPPAYGNMNSGIYDSSLPDELLGADKLFLRFVLSTTSNSSGITQNVAQFSRWDERHPDSISFALDAAYQPVPLPAAFWLLGSGLIWLVRLKKFPTE